MSTDHTSDQDIRDAVERVLNGKGGYLLVCPNGETPIDFMAMFEKWRGVDVFQIMLYLKTRFDFHFAHALPVKLGTVREESSVEITKRNE